MRALVTVSVGQIHELKVAFNTEVMAGDEPAIIDHKTFVGIAAAAATGILFGFLPARRAALLNPIDALRSE